jgi:hypothetical protein
MENLYSRQTWYSILRSQLYFLGWALVIHGIFLVILLVFAKQDWNYIWGHPLLSPLKGIRLWMAVGLVHGILRRNKKPLSPAAWGRCLLYMVFFTVFVSTLQIYYVHRKNTGWYDMATNERCYDRFHSFWLIQDESYFSRIDECLKAKMANEKNIFGNPKYVYTNTGTSNLSTYKTSLIDYDVFTPRFLWILIAFILISIIEMLRRYGAIDFSRRAVSWASSWKISFKGIRSAQVKIILTGLVLTLAIFIFFPRINGFPSQWVPGILLPAILVYSLRKYDFNSIIRGWQSFPGFPFIIIGMAIASLLLMILGTQVLYYLLVIGIVLLLWMHGKLQPANIKFLLLGLLAVHSGWVWADDGTWTTGGLDALVNDSAGTTAVDNVESLTDAIAVSIPLLVPDKEEPKEESVAPEEIIGKEDEKDQGVVQPSDTIPGTGHKPPVIDMPLGEDPLGNP